MAQRVAIFWDYETCRLPESFTVVEGLESIHAVASSCGKIESFNLYQQQSVDEDTLFTNFQLFQSSAPGAPSVNLVKCNKNDNSLLITKLTTDMLLFVLDVPAPATVVLLSGTPAFDYPLSSLRKRGYDTMLCVPSTGSNHVASMTGTNVVLHWPKDVLNRKLEQQIHEQNVSGATVSEREEGTASNFVRTKGHLGATMGGSHFKSENKSLPRPSEINQNWRVNPYPRPQELAIATRALHLDSEKGEKHPKDKSSPLAPLTDKTRDPNVPDRSKSSSLSESSPSSPPKALHPEQGRSGHTGVAVMSQSTLTPIPVKSTSKLINNLSGSGLRRQNVSREDQDSNLSSLIEKHDFGGSSSRTHSRIVGSKGALDGRLDLKTTHSGGLASLRADVSPQTIPEHLPRDVTTGFPSFTPLIDALLLLREKGDEQPLRSRLGNMILPDDLPAGIDLRRYMKLAEQAGVVELVGKGGTSRILLLPGIESRHS